ncbi:MAG: DUF3817 domain-containing protein [Bacteroidota bacterium]
MLSSSIGRLRLAGLVEGTSFLVLLFIAMPLKYLADQPEAVSVVGWIHGVLFVLFGVALLIAMQDEGWSLKKAAVIFVAAVVPFGPFVIDRQLKREQDAKETEAGGATA